MIAVLFACLCGAAVSLVLLVVLPAEEKANENATRNVVAFKARPLPPVSVREWRRREYLRQHRVGEVPERSL